MQEEFSAWIPGPPDVVWDLLREALRDEQPRAHVDAHRFDLTATVPAYRYFTVWVVGRFERREDGIHVVGVVEESPGYKAASWFAAAIVLGWGAWGVAQEPQLSTVVATGVGVWMVRAFHVGLRPGLVRAGARRMKSLLARVQTLCDLHREEMAR